MTTFQKIRFSIYAIIAVLFLSYFLYFNLSPCGISPFSCGDYAMDYPIEPIKIITPSGPEDMAFDQSLGYDRLIISCSPRRGESSSGSFCRLNVGDKEVHQMVLIPPDIKIYPHGIHVTEIDSIHWLYAISHEPTVNGQIDKILRFEILGDTLLLDNNSILIDPLLKIPNDLHVLSDGSMYVTNYLKKGTTQESLMTSIGKKTGDIIYYDGLRNWHTVLDNLCYPNGIWINENNQTLVFANGGCKEFLKYKIQAPGKVDVTSSLSTKYHNIDIPMGDNLVIDKEGALWTANHPCTLKFLKHAGDSDKKSPIQIRKLDPNTLKSEIVYQNNGEIISAASTAINVRGHLYISQVFDPFIVDLKID